MASSTSRQQLTSQSYRYDFCVLYYNIDEVRGEPDYEDGRRSLKFVKTLVKLFEKLTWPHDNKNRKLRGYYADRDLPPGRMIISEHFKVLGESRYTIVVLSPAFIRDCWAEYIAQSAFRELIGTSRFVPLAIHGVQPNSSGIPNQLNVVSIVYFRQGESPEEDERAWSKVKKTVLCENPQKRDLDEQAGASEPIVPERGDSEKTAAATTPRHEEENKMRMGLLIHRSNAVLQDVLSKQLQQTYPALFDPTDGRLFDILADQKVKHTLLRLKRRQVTNESQMELLYPSGNPSTTVALKDLDLTLTVILLRNITTLSPNASWENPSITDTSIEAQIGRVKKYRSYFLHVGAGLTDAEFQTKFTELKSLLLSLSPLYTSDDYDKLLTVPLHAAGQFPEEINRQDPLLQEAYQRALMDGFERVKRARVMLLGHSGAGKTHLRKRLLGKKYDEDKDRITNGIETDYVLVKEGWNSDEAECHGPAISCLLAENTRKIHEEIRGSHAASSKPSEKQSDVNQEEMITVAPSLSHLTLEDENTLQAEGQTVVHASQEKGLETQPSPKSSNLKTEENTELPPDVLTHLTESAYDIENPPARLTVWDFGGQSVYYNTHHTFLSSRAIYILAIDMSLDLTDRLEDQWHSAEQFSGTVLDFTVYWIDTIHTYASQQDKSEDGVSSPRIIIVCTHKDKYLENVPKERHEEKINAYFSTLRQHIQQKRSGVHVDPCFFAIDNTCQDEDHEITDLRQYVMKIAESQKSWGEKNPIRWSRLEDELELRQPPEKRKKKLTQYGELKKIALEVEMQDENELNSFLLFHHDIGDLLHPQRFGDLLHSQTVDLSDIVILNPWWLIDKFKSIITVDKHHVKTQGSLYWFALKRGILDERLLDELWGDDSELKPILISAMVKFNILLEQNLGTTEEPTCRQFYVPTLLPIYKNPASVVGSEDTLFIQGKDHFMPHVLFNRLTVKLVQNSTSTGRKVLRRRRDFFLFKNELYYDYAVFAIDPLRGARCALRKSIDSSCIELIPLYPPGAKFDATIQEAYDKFKGHVVTTLQELMKSICPRLQLEWCVRDPRNPKKLMAIDPKETDLTASGLPDESVYRIWFKPSSSEKVHGASPSAVRSPSDAEDAIVSACKAFPRKPGIVTVFPACKANEHYPPFIAVLKSNEFCGDKVAEYEGFTVNYYSWDMPDMEAQKALFSQEAAENPIPPEKSAEFGQVIQRVSQGLFANHKNLTIISASPVKVTGGKISCMPCIVLYCHTKGVVPLGDSLFPESIEGIPVDVREGYALLSMNNGQPQIPSVPFGQNAAFYSRPLRMGCSIGRRGLALTGTIGMFVEHKGSTYFLTCCHVLGIPQPPKGTEVCQPSDVDQETNYYYKQASETVDSSSSTRVCGFLKDWVFENVDIEGVQYGIDAALIKVNDISTYGIPAGLVPHKLRELGITENELLFSNKAYITSQEDLCPHDLFKCGRQTGITKGKVFFAGGAVYQPRTVGYCNNVGWTCQGTLSHMMEVYAPRTSSTTIFADSGDSGAAVFYLKNGKPYIVGMVVAKTSHFSAFVSPIWPILKHFKMKLAKEEKDMETE